jgi:hypothetical protein
MGSKRKSSAMRIGGFGLALLLTTASATSAAQTPAQKAAAQAMFDQAKELMKAGDYTTACKRFEESQRLDAAMGTQYRLAECYEKSGRLASAWSMYLEVADAARAAKSTERETFARDRATALKPKIASIFITVPPAVAALPGLHVERDGSPLGAGQWNAAVPVDGGEHVLKATAPGKVPWESKITVSEPSKTVNVTIPSLVDSPKESIADALPPEPEKRSVVPAVVLGGVAVIAAAVGGALLGVSGGKASDANTQAANLKGARCVAPPGTNTNAACTTLVDTAKSAGTLHNAGIGVFVGAGIAGVAAVTYLLLPSRATKKASNTGVRATPLVSPDGAALLVSGSF